MADKKRQSANPTSGTTQAEDPTVPEKRPVKLPEKLDEALCELESVVKRLEDGSLPLESSLELFEQGVTLTKLCNKKIHEAQRKVELLIKESEGSFKTTPFEEAIPGA